MVEQVTEPERVVNVGMQLDEARIPFLAIGGNTAAHLVDRALAETLRMLSDPTTFIP